VHDGADPYEVLGVARGATPAEIRRAYLALVERYHPDRHDGNPLRGLAEQRLAEVNAAYELLSDPRRRARHDAGPAPDPVPAGAPADARREAAWRWVRRALLLVAVVVLAPVLLRPLIALVRLLVHSGPAGIALGAVAVALLAAWLWRRRARPPV